MSEEIIITRSITELVRHGIRRISIALGVFDGVHLGHRRLLSSLAETAKETDSVPVAVTFSPHPRAVLFSQAPELIVSEEEKYILLGKAGAEAVVVIPFDAEFSRLSPESFLDRLFYTEVIRICGLCVGRNFCFGAGAEGDTSLLERRSLRDGFLFHAVPELEIAGETVSSTAVRKAVMEGCFNKAECFLGRPWSISGIVEHGQGLAGKLLNRPTANTSAGNTILPPFGVYAAFAYLEKEHMTKPHPAVVNIGFAPTIRATVSRPEVEAHLLGFSGNLYGTKIRLDMVSMIRAEKKFSSVEKLKEQICADAAEAYSILTEGKHQS